MIPKVIHYCWFGHNPLPKMALDCIASWRKFFPGYEIKEWNEDNFDVNMIPYTAQAYKAGKYAFVSDYARFWILYRYGGLYFDTDVEVIRDMSDIIARGAFMGCDRKAVENAHGVPSMFYVAPGLGMGAQAGLGVYKVILDYYERSDFECDSSGNPVITVVGIVTNLLEDHGLKRVNGIQQVGDVCIYPADYFNPIDVVTRKLEITPNTRSIHHYMASWMKPTFKIKAKNWLRKILPSRLLYLWNNRS